MTKEKKMKTSKAGKKVNKNMYPSQEEAKLIFERGNRFGDALIGILMQVAPDMKGIGIATIGMAKALSSLKFVANSLHANVDKLFEEELKYFDKEIKEYEN
jgi:hypothetical protein